MLRAFELVACGQLQFPDVVRAEIRQGVALEPCPQILDRIQVGRIWRQEGDLDMSVDAVEVLRIMRLGRIVRMAL